MVVYCAKLLRQVHEICRHDLKCRVRGEIWHIVRTSLQWTQDKGGLHSLGLGSAQVPLMGGDHHHLVATQSEEVDRHLVGTGIGFVGLHQLCRENAVPWQSTILR